MITVKPGIADIPSTNQNEDDIDFTTILPTLPPNIIQKIQQNIFDNEGIVIGLNPDGTSFLAGSDSGDGGRLPPNGLAIDNETLPIFQESLDDIIFFWLFMTFNVWI